MRNSFLALAMLFTLAACHNQEREKKVERNDQPDIYNVTEDDTAMNNAIAYAQKTLPEFDKALSSGDTAYSTFTLKMRFPTKDNSGEHMWIANIKKKNGEYFGILNNQPEYTDAVKMGDSITVPLKDISDWMFMEGRKLHGGYTIRVLRNRMSDSEKKQFDQEQGMIIE